MKKDSRKIKRLEDIWQEIGVPLNEYFFNGYILAHFEGLHLGLRKLVCVNIYPYPDKEEAMMFINRCCNQFDCQIVHNDEYELWITKTDCWYFEGEIPSRFSEKEEDHRLRGQLLGYSDAIIDSYFQK